MNNKCEKCGKKVYHAEQKLAEGKTWHNLCWSLEFKEREAAKKAVKEEISYARPADVRPEYYRVADVDEGLPPRLQSSDGKLAAVSNQQTSVIPSAQEKLNNSNNNNISNVPKFCVSCGNSRQETDKFCANCGTKY